MTIGLTALVERYGLWHLADQQHALHMARPFHQIAVPTALQSHVGSGAVRRCAVTRSAFAR
jgi:hypothetical protein